MKIIYLILLFLAPGLIINAITDIKAGKHNSKQKNTIYEQLLTVVIYSVIVSTISILLMSAISHFFNLFDSNTSLAGFIKSLDYMPKLLTYLVIMVAICFVTEFVLQRFIMPKLFEFRNDKLNKAYGVRQAQIGDPTVWEDILLDKERGENTNIVVIYQGNERITAGFLTSWNSSSSDPKEIELTRTQEISKIIQLDINKPRNERWLKDIEKEYFDLEHNIRIEFYDNKKVIEHWEDFEL